MSADLQFKQLIDRILRARAAEDDAKQDTKEIYAELKSLGYDKTAAGALVTEIRNKDKNPDQFEERNAVLDLYRIAYERASHAHTREANEPDHTSKSTAARNGAGKSGVTAGETATSFIAEPGVVAEATGNDLREPVAAKQGQIIRGGDAPRETGRFGGDASVPDTEFPSPEPVPPLRAQADRADEVASSPASSATFLNPRCQKPDDCDFANSRDCCHDCLLAWGSRPRDEQRRLWQEAERTAQGCEAA